MTEKTHIIKEIVADNITGVKIDGEEIVRVNQDCSWEIDKVLTDYCSCDERHEMLVVAFKRKKEGQNG